MTTVNGEVNKNN